MDTAAPMRPSDRLRIYARLGGGNVTMDVAAADDLLHEIDAMHLQVADANARAAHASTVASAAVGLAIGFAVVALLAVERMAQ